MNKKLLKQLKEKLPKNFTSTLSKRCEVSTGVVSKVLNGKYRDYHGIINEALKLKREHEKALKEEEERLKNELGSNH